MGFRKWLSKAEEEEASRLPSQRAAPDKALHAAVVEVLHTVYDPEIPVNIYDLGLIYGLHAGVDGKVRIRMTLTAPGCPVAQTFPEMVANVVRLLPGVEEVQVEMVWDPPWSREKMSEAARLELGML